jgi:hypothetical protein
MMNVHRRRDMIWCFVVQSMKDLGIRYSLDPIYRIQHLDDEEDKKISTNTVNISSAQPQKQPFLFKRR